MKDFKNKIVVITGASSGIGKATAYAFAQLNAKVCLIARRKDLLDEICNDLISKGKTVLAVVADVSQELECQNAISTIVETFGTIDILINNAGISMRATFEEVHLSVLKRLMDVNFWGAVYCTKYALPYLLKNKGVLVGVSSIAGFQGLPGRTGYSASKFALHGFLETIRVEHLKSGLHVMVLAPGFTASDVRKHALLANGNEQGETPRNEEKMMSAERVAKILIRSIRRRKRNKIMTIKGQLTVLFQRIIPNVVDNAIYKDMAKERNSPI